MNAVTLAWVTYLCHKDNAALFSGRRSLLFYRDNKDIYDFTQLDFLLERKPILNKNKHEVS